MSDRKSVAIIVILVTVLGMGVSMVVIGLIQFLQSGPIQVPPPSLPPGEDPDIIVSHNLEIWAEAIYSQDFMPFIPEEGPPFNTIIWVNVTNTGNTTVSNFEAVRTTIYFHNNSMPLVTLNLIIVGDPAQIDPGESLILRFTNDRESIFSPTIDEGAVLYSRILTRWGDGIEEILTTPPSAVGYTH
ncbi:hypothetical protein E4H12_06805 [Candidatus Thorarchaeota archaeon]|nr:MAG: hypothetical protein E4H12_06805 [Candidatus Thorarchaeota archaeon]